jgi:hypothetical protein
MIGRAPLSKRGIVRRESPVALRYGKSLRSEEYGQDQREARAVSNDMGSSQSTKRILKAPRRFWCATGAEISFHDAFPIDRVY